MGMNPRYNNWTRAQWMGRAAKVGDLQRQGWPVVACCLHCHLEMTVDLAVVRRALGEDFVLWGRTARCRRRHCQGRMCFWTYPPEGRGLKVEMF
ncbi:hypothetical protein BDI01nite_31470 [Brevundimonas diminuta]|jgi:hypothetical protein|nr:hypothetical protein [Brevundimonas diminuta]GEC02083.1 hypothetical protein BDI01nite_31470 [Brevundimonas diminuta]